MRKRFLWTVLISAVIISLIIPANLGLMGDTSPGAQGRLNFFSLILIETLLVVILTFLFINEFFILHPDYTSLIQQHKEVTGIPEKYYEPVGKDKESK